LAVQSECAAWLDALPEALRDGATGEALQAIVDLDLDELASIEPPRGFWARLIRPVTATRPLHPYTLGLDPRSRP